MRAVRRRPADPVLRWRSAGQNQQYRVTVRNEDRPDRRMVYEGYRTDCHLPADLRLTSDQLSYRVEYRPADTPTAGYKRCVDFTAIPRLGDELDPDAADRLVVPETAGASAYRLQIRDVLSEDILVDFVSDQPSFLLPAGQLGGRKSEWMVRAKVGGGWRGQRYDPVTPSAIEAARARAERLIVIADEVRPQLTVDDVERPALTRSRLPDAPRQAPAAAISVIITAQPQLAREPTADSVLSIQWSDGQGGGAVESVARMLEARGLKAWFFVDVELGLALDPEALARLCRRLVDAGHRIGLYLGRDKIVPPGLKPGQRLARMFEALNDLAPSGPRGVMMDEGPDRLEWLDALPDFGVSGVVVTRAAAKSLPNWFRWRTTPFIAGEALIALPTAMFLSTPAHARDRVTRHPLANRDALAAGSALSALQAKTGVPTKTLILAEIDPNLLMDRRKIDDRVQADIWNSLLEQDQPGWLGAGWKRSKSFEIARGVSEIQQALLAGMLDTLAASPAPWADWISVFDRSSTTGWLPPNPAFEPLVEQRRATRDFRPSAIRRYDNVYRLALGARS